MREGSWEGTSISGSILNDIVHGKILDMKVTARVAFYLFSFLLACAAIFPAESGAVTVGNVEIKGLSLISRDEFLDILGIRAGVEIDRELVSNGIKRAFLKGFFDDIIIHVPDGENPVVEVEVRERDFIRKIYLKNKTGISDKTIKDLFIIKENEAMRHDIFEQAKARLKESIANYGYPEASIAIATENAGMPHKVNIQLTVDGGPPLLIRNINIVLPPSDGSATGIGTTGVLSALKLSPGDVFNRMKLEEGLKNVRERLKKEGYYKPKVGPYSYKEGDLTITVDPGKRLSVNIDGNSSISTKSLLKEAAFFEIEDFRDEVIGEAVDRMLALYHQRGYAFAQIAPVTKSDAQTINITFFVFEGEKVKIKSIEFSGASIPNKGLKDVMALSEGEVYNPDQVEKDKDLLKDFYGGLGYLDATVKEIMVRVDKEKQTAQIVVEIDEGKRTEIGNVDITGTDAQTKDKLLTLAGLKPGDPYNELNVSDARFKILDYYANSGYMNVDVTVTRSVENYKASVLFKVVGGEEKFFGKTIIIGNQKTRYLVFKRELLYKEGQPYSFRLLSEERQALYKLGLFTSVEVETIDGEDSKKDVLLRVTEGNAGSVDFGFGYADYEHFRGFVGVSYRNLWGMNREGSLRLEVSSLQDRLILQYIEPWFLGKKLPLRTFMLYEYKAELDVPTKQILYKLHRYSITAGVEKKLSNTTKTEFYYEFSLVRTYDVKPDVVLTKEDTGTLAISGIKPAIVYDTRDNPINPKKGVVAGISVKLATFLFLSEADFVKAEAYGSTFHTLSKRITLALSLRGGVARGFGSAVELPLVERFFLGGRSTVRGYVQDGLGPKGPDGTTPTGGNAYLMGNIEFRTDIGKGFGLVPFFDFGNVWVRASDINPLQLRGTTGLGLRYDTPVGPLRVDYGVKLSRQTGENKGEVHFSVGHAF
ncbi:putative Outer membrane protein, OMP85 family [Candidatus Sulfobium mesophilum]|uniref:Outer membrane protein assembly factor BamA n=1 Tax=Candidatus Sulfobium mesophilum TaxID=2016548 RepID=A0A2U3QKI2_9BACT|nr:putative Outer membrane protein, OMP85 family [Candidatus Sulfobium mesophilum]